jgi:hypothetical protein
LPATFIRPGQHLSASVLDQSRSKENPTMVDNDMTVVKMLLDIAHLTVSEEELERFSRTYSAIRVQADALYREEFRSEQPALAFDPLSEYT